VNLLYVVAGTVDVVENASARARVVGTVRAGGTIELGTPPVATSSDGDCAGGWYAALPRGFVCANAKTTRNGRSRAAEVLRDYRVAQNAALPASYGIAEVTPVYSRLPTWDEQLRSEPGLEAHLHKRAAEREAREAARAWGDVSEAPDRDLYPAGVEVPEDLKGGSFAPLATKPLVPGSPVAGFLAPGARVAWVGELDASGRTWLLTPELAFVPRDKVKRGVVSGFHGIEVPAGKGVAFAGRRLARKYKREVDQTKFVAGENIAPETALLLAGAAPSAIDTRYIETAEPGTFVRTDEVILANPSSPARLGLDAQEAAGRWIDVDAKTQVLLLRDGAAVTYATLVSCAADTRRGKFRVSSKHLTHPMLFERQRPAGARAEVPEVLLLSELSDGAPSSALFAGWWMNSWGIPTGGFGIALSSLDGRRVFDFASPELPDGWHSVRGEGLWVVVHD
jgi:hypothetical protein